MEERNYKLYVHISPSNKRYYGITYRKVQDRWNNGKGYTPNKHFTSAINKYGWENFQHIILFNNLTKEEASLLEQMYIALYNTTNRKYGYNNSLGGEHGLDSEQTKKKKSESHKGIQLTEETKRKISEANKGHEVTEETKKKISEANKGRQFTEEHIKNLSQSMKGKNKHWGKDNPNAKPVLMFTKHDEFIKRFDSVADANIYLGKKRNYTGVMQCAKGKTKTAYGYKWIYEEDYIK